MRLTRDAWFRALIVLLTIIAGLYLAGLIWQLFQQFADVIVLFFFAWLVAFLLEPIVQYFNLRYRMKRGAAVALTYLVTVVVMVSFIVLIVPVLAMQLGEVGRQLPGYNERLLELARGGELLLRERGVQIDLPSALRPEALAQRLEAFGPVMVAQAVAVATEVANIFFRAIIVIVLSYYMVADSPRIGAAVLRTLPPDFRNHGRYFFVSVNRAFGGFIRGQILQGAVYGLGTLLIMSVFGVPFGLLSGFVAGMLMLIPFIGPAVGLVPPLGVTLMTHSDAFWPVCIGVLALQQVIVNFLAPRLMSRAMGLHPLVVFLAVLLGAKLAGLWGAIFGVPVAGVIVAMATFFRSTVEERQAWIDQLPARDEAGMVIPPSPAGSGEGSSPEAIPR